MFNWLRGEPKQLVEQRRRMSETLGDYPVYQPLHRQGPNSPRHFAKRESMDFAARGRENFDQFLTLREQRLGALKVFLAKFDVDMNLDDAGLAEVSAWCPGHCGALVAIPINDQTFQAFIQLQPWTGELRGLNVIFDLGIYLGECVIARNPRCHWDNFPGVSDDGHANSFAWIILGFRLRRDWLTPMTDMLYACNHDERDLRQGTVGRRVRPDNLVGKVRDYSTR